MREVFRDTAIRLLVGVGVPATEESVQYRADHRAKFRAILVEGKRRHAIDSPAYCALQALIDECDRHAERDAVAQLEAKLAEVKPIVLTAKDAADFMDFNKAMDEVKRNGSP